MNINIKFLFLLMSLLNNNKILLLILYLNAYFFERLFIILDLFNFIFPFIFNIHDIF